MSALDADELALLRASFEAAMAGATGPAEVDAALFALGWDEVLAAEPARGAAVAFGALGATGMAGGLLDDVVACALGLAPSPERAVVLPAPGRATAPGRLDGETLVVDGVVSARGQRCRELVVPCGSSVAILPGDALVVLSGDVLDPGGAFQRVRATVAAPGTPDHPMSEGAWGRAVAAARGALAHELLAAGRTMLDQARRHALDRHQFGRPVASFQAVRHRLAESLVQLEGAAAVAGAWAEGTGGAEGTDPLVAALAKSLAGRAALATARHAQQVLAGVGFTTEHPFQAVMKRVLTIDVLFGSAATLPAEIGAELLARGGAPRLVEL